MQVMPGTARELGYKPSQMRHPESNIEAGVRYLSQQVKRFEASLDRRQRIRFALASYNAGYGHVRDARRLARQKGWDPDRWFQNVERAMRLLEKPYYAQRARYGYCRGSEPVAYVSKIQTKYDAYTNLIDASAVNDRVK